MNERLSTLLFVIIVYLFGFNQCQVQDKNVGCYKVDPESRSLSFQPDNLAASETVDSCITECLRYFFRYAGLRAAKFCHCGSTYSNYGEGSCNMPCLGNTSQFCGGESSMNVFDTGQKVSGPPSSLQTSNMSERGMKVAWSPPKAPNGVIISYTVTAELIDTFSKMKLSPNLIWTYSDTARQADVLDLHPASEYNISVRADTKEGPGVPLSLIATTLVGEPEVPLKPEIIERDPSQDFLVVKIHTTTSNNGPITAYQIVVINGFADFSPELLDTYHNAQRSGVPLYITAVVKPENLKENFKVGDGRLYDGYFNAPVPIGQDVRIVVGAVSSFNNHTRISYSVPSSQVINVGNPSNLEQGLTVAIIVCSILLLLLILAYFAARHFVPQRRNRGATRMQDPQELCLQGPIIEVENYGYVPEEEESEKQSHYERLKKLVWDIPRNFLDVRTNDILGNGAFGTVCKGTVLQNGFPIPAAIYCVDDRELSPTVKRSMHQELGVLVRCGTSNHSNVIRLLGVCESPETVFVVLEFHPASLKDMLLESRTLVRPAHERDLSVVCSLPQKALLQVAIGIAQGMQHLANNKMIHKQLAACSILMADGMVPKVANFGIARYSRPNVEKDFTRWTAREVFSNRHYSVKSDVWSMGCLLWEIAALGGTPYVAVPTQEVGSRIMRGLRLHQMSHVSDELNQLMFNCWQLDLDERPTFAEISRVLCDLLESSMPQLDWAVMPGFHYEQHIPEFEHLPR